VYVSCVVIGTINKLYENIIALTIINVKLIHGKKKVAVVRICM